MERLKTVPREKWDVAFDLIKKVIKAPELFPDRALVLTLTDEEWTVLFTPRRIELIKTIRTEKPGSVSELAKLVGRKVEAVDRDLKILETHGIIELERVKNRVTPRIKKEFIILPIIGYKGIEEIKIKETSIEKRVDKLREELNELRESIKGLS